MTSFPGRKTAIAKVAADRFPGGGVARGGQEDAATVPRDTGVLAGSIPAAAAVVLPPDGRADVVNGSVTSDVVHLVESALRGEAEGWDALFHRFYPAVRRYALARTGDRAAAEEVAQEVFVAAVRRISGLRERSAPGVEGWFIAIARNQLTDRARRSTREQRLSVRPETAPDAADVATSNLAAAELRRALDDLTDDQRDVLIRRFLLDHSIDDVATATGRTAGAVKTMQHRALTALKKRLGQDGWR